MTKKPFISIIIPVYNVEKYLKECLDSILSQQDTFDDFELILVDDGSKDNSGAICDEYSKNNVNKVDIRTLHLENGGPSRARNIGLETASGEYILFIDSDDYIADGSLSKIVEACKSQGNPDIVFLMAKKFSDGSEAVDLEEHFDSSRLIGKEWEEVFGYIGERAKYPASPCMKLLKRQFLVDNNILFEVGKKAEDLDWAMDCLLNAKSFGCYNGDYYYYRQDTAKSNSKIFAQNKYDDIKAVLNKWVARAENEKFEIVKKTIIKFTCYEYVIFLKECTDYVKQDAEWHKQMMDLVKTQADKRNRLVVLVAKLLGLKNTCRLLKLYTMRKK